MGKKKKKKSSHKKNPYKIAELIVKLILALSALITSIAKLIEALS